VSSTAEETSKRLLSRCSYGNFEGYNGQIDLVSLQMQRIFLIGTKTCGSSNIIRQSLLAFEPNHLFCNDATTAIDPPAGASIESCNCFFFNVGDIEFLPGRHINIYCAPRVFYHLHVDQIAVGALSPSPNHLLQSMFADCMLGVVGNNKNLIAFCHGREFRRKDDPKSTC